MLDEPLLLELREIRPSRFVGLVSKLDLLQRNLVFQFLMDLDLL